MNVLLYIYVVIFKAPRDGRLFTQREKSPFFFLFILIGAYINADHLWTFWQKDHRNLIWPCKCCEVQSISSTECLLSPCTGTFDKHGTQDVVWIAVWQPVFLTRLSFLSFGYLRASECPLDSLKEETLLSLAVNVTAKETQGNAIPHLGRKPPMAALYINIDNVGRGRSTIFAISMRLGSERGCVKRSTTFRLSELYRRHLHSLQDWQIEGVHVYPGQKFLFHWGLF